MKYFFVLVLSLLWLDGAAASGKKLNVLACEAEWAALANSLGGEFLNISSATTFMQDPHHIQARPSLLAKARNADLIICSGSELEVGWLPVLLRKSGNQRIQPGQPGYFMATDHVLLLDKPTRVDRAGGDVHAAGNPHIHFDPHRIKQVAQALADRLAQLSPQQQTAVQKNLATFTSKLDSSLQNLSETIAGLQGKSIVVHHNSWTYLSDWLGLNKIAELEPKPGLPPSSSHLSSLIQLLDKQKADAIIYSSYQDDKPANWLASRTGVAALGLPYSVEDWQQPDALVSFYQQLVTLLDGAMQQPVAR